MSENNYEESFFVEHIACPACRSRGRDNAGDNLAIYSDGTAICYACDYRVKSLEDLEEESEFTIQELTEMASAKPKGEPITKDQREFVKSKSTMKGSNFRGINDETLEFYKFRTGYKDTGEVGWRYYPVYAEGSPTAYKVRCVENKDFYRIRS